MLTALGALLFLYATAGQGRQEPSVAMQCGSVPSGFLSQVISQLPDVTTLGCSGRDVILTWPVTGESTQLILDVDGLPVMEEHEFYGLASYYNSVRVTVVDKDGVMVVIRDGDELTIGDDQTIAFIGRLETLLLRAPGTVVGRNLVNDPSQLSVMWPAGIPGQLELIKTDKDNLHDIDPVLSGLRYSHLWDWLAGLSRGVEWSLEKITQLTGVGWGWTIVIFSVLLKVLLLPVSLVTVHFQRQVSQFQAILGPQLADIKSKYDGEEAHEKIMAAHKSLGITPFYSLKPMLGAFIQVPVLVAVFNALGEMPQLAGVGFLWIDDIAYPDAIGTFSTAIPMFGDRLSLLPILMTLVTVFSTLIFQNRHAPETEVRRQKRNLYFMAAAFFVLFYPFPAAMVLYWTLANILQTIQQQLVRI
jgi:YidC/Oxa1 family membrane protein insertase